MPSDRAVSRALNRVMDACRNLISRGVVTRTDDAPKMQTLQITLLEDEVQDGVERFQQYGLTSRPLEGAEAVCFFVGADRSHPVVLAVDDRRFRFTTLKPGEVCLYTDEGDSILFGRDRHITISTMHLSATIEDATINAASRVMVNTPETEFSGHVTIRKGITWGGTANGLDGPARMEGGLTNTGGEITSNGKVLDSHVHTGVEPGGGTTGGPV